MEEVSWKQEVLTLNAKSASNGTGKLFYSLILTSIPASDMLIAHLPLPSLGIPRTIGVGNKPTIHCRPKTGGKKIRLQNRECFQETEHS
jgi:hypothetical protein